MAKRARNLRGGFAKLDAIIPNMSGTSVLIVNKRRQIICWFLIVRLKQTGSYYRSKRAIKLLCYGMLYSEAWKLRFVGILYI